MNKSGRADYHCMIHLVFNVSKHIEWKWILCHQYLPVLWSMFASFHPFVPALCRQMAPLPRPCDRETEISSRDGHLCFIIFSSVLDDGHEISHLRYFFFKTDFGNRERRRRHGFSLSSNRTFLLYCFCTRAFIFRTNLPFLVRQERDRMPRHIREVLHLCVLHLRLRFQNVNVNVKLLPKEVLQKIFSLRPQADWLITGTIPGTDGDMGDCSSSWMLICTKLRHFHFGRSAVR
jgi:hypothetical protein